MKYKEPKPEPQEDTEEKCPRCGIPFGMNFGGDDHMCDHCGYGYEGDLGE